MPENAGNRRGKSAKRCRMRDNSLVNVLIACRAEKRLSLEDVAKQIGITRASLCNIERGLSRPRRTTRYLLAIVLRKYGYVVPEEEAA